MTDGPSLASDHQCSLNHVSVFEGELEPERLFTSFAAATCLKVREPIGVLIRIEPGLQFHY